MKRSFLVILICLVVTIASGQESDIPVYGVFYSSNYTIHPDRGEYKEAFILLVNDEKSLFQSTVTMAIDTLMVKQQNNEITEEELFDKFQNLTTYHRYHIEIVGDTVSFDGYNAIDHKIYHEILDFNWEIGDLEKEIAGYKCKNATVNYGGRTWTAWYAVDLPINAGPYKFKGLPGLILEVYDADRAYMFNFLELRKVMNKERKLAKYFIPNEDFKLTETTRLEFNKLRRDFEFFNDEEQNEILKDKGIMFVGSSTNSESLRDTNKKKVASNFIEID